MRTRGIGSKPNPYMLISDYPGRVEAQCGIPLSGKTGDEVNRRLDGVKLPEREEWFISNLIREWNPDNEYTNKDVERDERELVKELAEVRPKLIVTLGRWSCRWFLGDVNLDETQAIPWRIWLCGECLQNRIENGSSDLLREQITDAGFGWGFYLRTDTDSSLSEDAANTKEGLTESHTYSSKDRYQKDIKSTTCVVSKTASTQTISKQLRHSKIQDGGVLEEHTASTDTCLQKRILTTGVQKPRAGIVEHAGPLENENRPTVCAHTGKEECCVVPIFNPAAGFRSPEAQAQTDFGFRELALYFEGKTEPRELFKDEYPNPTYVEITDPRWLDAGLSGVREIHIDTEGKPARVWSIQWCLHPGTAYMVRFTNRKCLLALIQWLLRERPTVVYHGSLHDFGIMRAILVSLGLPVEALYDIPFEDTQIMAYLLQLEPIGLKPNCVRHCNMVMQDYHEVLGDAQIQLSQDYLIKVFDTEQARYEIRQQEEFERINSTPLTDADGKPKVGKDGVVKMRRTRVLPKLPKTDLHKAALRVLGAKDPYKLWGEQREDIQAEARRIEV